MDREGGEGGVELGGWIGRVGREGWRWVDREGGEGGVEVGG